MFPQEMQIPHKKQVIERQTFPDSAVIFETFYNFDRDGHLVEVEYRKYGEDGQLCDSLRDTYQFDSSTRRSMGQKISASGSLRGTEEIHYDDAGRRAACRSCDASGEEYYIVKFAYDKSGRLKEVRRYPNSGDNSFTVYTFNAKGHLDVDETCVSPPGMEAFVTERSTYTYNAHGQLTAKVTLERPFEGAGTKTTYEYDGAGRLIKTQFYRFDAKTSILNYTNAYSYSFY